MQLRTAPSALLTLNTKNAASTLSDRTAEAAPRHRGRLDGRLWAECVAPPRPWFLPGPIRIRGGAARHFASDWLFHRGIHLEATPADPQEFSTRYQQLMRHRLWLSGIHHGIHLASFGNPPLPKSHLRKPPAPTTLAIKTGTDRTH